MNIKEKVLAASPIFGTHTNLSDVAITQIYGALGYDFIWVDMEHTTLSCEQVHMHLLAAKAEETPVFVRVPADDLTNTKRILEMGPDGIIFPMVRDYKHACELLSNTLYPPYGKRGCGPRGAVRYGIDNEPQYYKEGHLQMCRFVQIELASAVQEVEKIASIPYLDGCILGMHDLSGSINRLGDVFCKENLVLAKKTIEAFRDAGKTVGVATFATDDTTLKCYYDMGINMIATGADYDYILRGARKTLEACKNIMNVTEK